MKLLLTSAGIRNEEIANALDELTDIRREDLKIGFIPTAANGEPGNKDWFFNQIYDLHKHKYGWIDVIDFSANNVNWEDRLNLCDVVYLSGGNTFHLLKEVRESGFDEWILENVKVGSKVYVGVSAGSILATPTISIATVEPADENLIGIKELNALKLVDFEISPHTPDLLSYEANEDYANNSEYNLYTLDDNSAIQVSNNEIKIVSTGEWRKY